MTCPNKPCNEVLDAIPLYCYGELSSEKEEEVESHFASCPSCRAELQKHRRFLDLLDDRREPVDAGLLALCRSDLRAALAVKNQPSFWSQIWQRQIRFSVPVGAMALVALGYFGARVFPSGFMGNAEPMFSSVRSVESDVASGQVRVAVDEIRRHVISGTARDPRIASLLLSAAHEESNPGIRVESIGLLQGTADSAQVRQVLIDALTHDPNAGVRLKALEALKPYAGDGVVRRTLANVLLKDDNPGVRVQAIDLLTAHHDDSIVGVLQDAVRKEDNNYVRAQSARLLEEMKASVGTY
jgi:hypothetical protein